MKAYGIAIWLRNVTEGGAVQGTREFSDRDIAAWEAAERKARRREWLGRALAWRPALQMRPTGNLGAEIATR